MGANTAEERTSVGNAFAQLSSRYGSGETMQAMTDAAPTIRSLTQGAGSGTQLAAALNRPDFGSVVGSFGEQPFVASGRAAQLGGSAYPAPHRL